MSALPSHVATDDEPLPELRETRFSGPDLALVTPLATTLRDLGAMKDDVDEYLDLFCDCLEEAGIYVSLTVDRNGEEYLGAGAACDSQMRHRNRIVHFLFADLDGVDGAREELHLRMWRRGRVADNRPVERRHVTAAVRDYLRTDGRILITPGGTLTEGGGIPRAFLDGSDEQAAEYVRATRAYHNLNLRQRAQEQIKRAVRMLGSRTENGWQVLEARP